MFKYFMKIALSEAKNSLNVDEVPVGCVIVMQNKIIATTHNMMKTNRNNTEHAEIIAIRMASKNLNSGYLNECDLYVTLEPCTMCAAAISFARIRRVYCGTLDPKSGGIYNNAKLFYYNKGLSYIPEHYNGFSEKECEKLIKDFFIKKRKNGA